MMNTDKRILFLIDDGWRHEKRVILDYLVERLPIRVITHDPWTKEIFDKYTDTTLLAVDPIRRHPLYAPLLFFAKEMDTVVTQRERMLRLRDGSAFGNIMHILREMVGRLGLRRYRYEKALSWLYRGSNCYHKLLADYDVLVYSPVGVLDKRVVFEAKAAGLKIISWVYSWDNPIKDNEFLTGADAYLVWNEENREDLVHWHGILRDRIHITGAAQIDYLLGKPPKSPQSVKRRYVLYPCATGRDVFIAQEVDLILWLRKLIDKIDRTVELVVRPYPFRQGSKNYYRELEKADGISVAYFGKWQRDRLIIDEQAENERYIQFRDALCMINLGSTIGIEAAFTNTPIIQLAFCDVASPSKKLALATVFKNEHLKYLLNNRFPNVVNNAFELEKSLRHVLAGDIEQYMSYSSALRRFADPMNVSSYKKVLCDVIEAIDKEWRQSV